MRVAVVRRLPGKDPVSDTSAPTAPSSLSAAAASSSVINLTWTGSTDNVGVTAYLVERSLNGATGWTEIGQPAAASYSDTGRAASTQYFYRVRARDAALNLSGYSNVANATTQATSAVFPLSVSGHQLLQSNGAQFLAVGDTPWCLHTALTDAEAIQYLDDRQARGFNAIITEIIEKGFSPNRPNTIAGLAPFLTPDDIRTPNDVYFNRIVTQLGQGRTRGMVFLSTPIYYGFGGGSEGWWTAVAARTLAECQAFGAYLGTKFSSVDNLVWVMGGDYYAASTLSRTQAIVAGIKSTDRADRLFTYHAQRGDSSADVVNGESWLNVNAIYTSNTDIVSELETGYGVTPTRPTVYFEGNYEGEGATAQELRAQAYSTTLTGGMGAFLGNNPIWTGGFGWQTALNSAGTQDRQRWATFFKSFNWFNLVPDRNDTVLTAGQGTGSAMAYAARMSDGSKIVVYTPTQKALTIALSQITGSSCTASWFNPSTGATTSAGTFGVTGTQNFTPPSSGDWVLVLDAVQSSFTPFYVGKFNVGTNGQPANVEYTGNSALGSNNLVYTNDVPGPFGETKVGKVQLLPYTTSEYYYGGFVRTPTPIPATTGAEMWARAYFRFPANWCNGGQGKPPFPESVNGAIKFFRLFFDTSNRLTLMLGNQNQGGPGEFIVGCANPATTPVLGMANSEIGSTNHFATTFPVLTRDQWWALQWYVKFGTADGSDGIFRAWVNSTRVINATNVKTRPSTAPTTVANGFAMPGDLWNGGPGNNNPFYVANMIMATSVSPPTTLDSGGVPFIHPSLDAMTL